MPKLWNETIAAHRDAVREAILDAAWALVTERGLTAVTMSQIAGRAGIGRATLYKYFPDVEAILVAWHERQVAAHLRQLTEIRDRETGPGARLGAVMAGYAFSAHHQSRHAGELAGFLHRGEHLVPARQQLTSLLTELLADAATAGEVRDDIPPHELAAYCLHALSAAADLPGEAAVRRLVEVTAAGLRPGH
ncbi:MAG TPA: TetR/AcrR family transcriptional regulator [Trebonia sp.]